MLLGVALNHLEILCSCHKNEIECPFVSIVKGFKIKKIGINHLQYLAGPKNYLISF